MAFSPRMTSLSVQRKPDLTSADERFNMLLEKEVCCSSALVHLFKQAAYMICSSGWCQLACQAAVWGLGMHTCEAAGQRLSFMRTSGLGVCASTLKRATGRGLGRHTHKQCERQSMPVGGLCRDSHCRGWVCFELAWLPCPLRVKKTDGHTCGCCRADACRSRRQARSFTALPAQMPSSLCLAGCTHCIRRVAPLLRPARLQKLHHEGEAV